MSTIKPRALQDAGARLRLVLARPRGEGAPGVPADPFLEVGDRGAFSRALLAELVGPSGGVISTVILKIQSDEYPVAVASSPGQPTNLHVEDAWRREVEVLEACGKSHPGIAPIIEVFDRRPGEPGRLPPTLYCREKEAFFVAPCPECGGALGDVRDPDLLDSEGLPAFDRSLERFLGCPRCLAEGRSPRLWTLIKDPEGPLSDRLSDQVDLLAALGPLARRSGEGGEDDGSIPCRGCPELESCHPVDGRLGAGLSRIVPLTFYESRCLAFPLYPMRFDEYVGLVGGLSFDDLRSTITTPGRLVGLDDSSRLVAGGRSLYFFEHDAGGKLGLEVLRLKVSAVLQLCEAVAALHRHARMPHLALSPGQVLVRLDERGRSAPVLWGVDVALLGLGNVRTRACRVGRIADLPAAPFLPPRAADAVFSAPPLREPESQERMCELSFQRVFQAASGEAIVEALVESGTIDFASIGDKDTITLSVVQARPPLSLSLLGSAIGSTKAGMSFRSVPFPLSEQARQQIQQLVGQRISRARINVHPCLNVPCDVHGLGMMLGVALLANAEQDAFSVGKAMQRVSSLLEEEAASRPGMGLAEVSAAADRILGSTSEEGAFARRNLFHHPKRHAKAATFVPEGLWRDVLVTALRATTRIRGFSICRSFSDFDPRHPEVNAEFMVQLLRALLRRVDSRLFGLPGRSRELREAIQRVRKNLGKPAVIDRGLAGEVEAGASGANYEDDRTRFVRPGSR